MKLVALIVTSFAAVAPIPAFAGTGSDQTSVQVPNAPSQLAWGETCSNDANSAAVNVNVQACDIGVDIL